MKQTLTGTPWENFKKFLVRMSELYEEISKTGTVELDEGNKEVGIKKCSFCKRKGHTDEECWKKKSQDGTDDGRRKAFAESRRICVCNHAAVC